jgi:hypothetical protein
VKRSRITEALPAYLRRAAARRFKYGSFDCFLFVADWCAEMRGVDPASHIRGRYDDLSEGLALAGARSLPVGFHRVLGASGLRRTRSPEPGDVALIALADGVARGSIMAGAGYVLLGENGLSRVDIGIARLVAAWSV